MELEFWKMSGAGNDFIALDNMAGRFPEAGRSELFRRWCRRGTGIGADGVLVMEKTAGSLSAFRMRYYNADGGEADTCGNGSRCIARFAHMQGVAESRMRFDTKAGPYQATVLAGGEVKLELTPATGYREGIAIGADPGAADTEWSGEVDFIDTGVPHAVMFVPNVARVDVERVGRFLRHHPAFAPTGANVNFVRVRDPRHLEIRTYERGVEGETLACGTGAVAASIVAAHRLMAQSPVLVKTASGEILEVAFETTSGGAAQVSLQGGADLIFRGIVAFNPAARGR